MARVHSASPACVLNLGNRQKGKVLTGFLLSFINASREDFNQEFEREFTHISVQLDGLYFVSDRTGQFEFGVRGGWYIPAAEVFGGVGDMQFFVDGGISWLQNKYNVEPANDWDRRNQLGFQIGSGLLFLMGRRIALETKLGFRLVGGNLRFFRTVRMAKRLQRLKSAGPKK